MRSLLLAGLSLALVPVPATALISTVAFHGFGRVTYVNVTQSNLLPPTVGAPVRVTGTFDLGPAAVADHFTGSVYLDEDQLFDRQQSFSWTVAGGRSSATSHGFAYAGGVASFIAGRLTSISLYNDYDSDIESLGATTWSAVFPYADSSWGGSWALSVPEPSSWALMIAGFGLSGLQLRRRSRRAI